MFSNNGIGLLDQATLNNELMLSMMIPLALEDHGAIVFIYVPKLIGQSHEKAELVLFNAINKIKAGDFSEDMLEAAKTTIIRERVKGMEGIENIAELMMDLESRGLTVEEYIAENNLIAMQDKTNFETIFSSEVLVYHLSTFSATISLILCL